MIHERYEISEFNTPTPASEAVRVRVARIQLDADYYPRPKNTHHHRV
jgi:uncharacterized protein YpmS